MTHSHLNVSLTLNLLINSHSVVVFETFVDKLRANLSKGGHDDPKILDKVNKNIDSMKDTY